MRVAHSCHAKVMHELDLLLAKTKHRVAGHKPGKHGKHGKPGKVREFEKLSKSQGKLKEF